MPFIRGFINIPRPLKVELYAYYRQIVKQITIEANFRVDGQKTVI